MKRTVLITIFGTILLGGSVPLSAAALTYEGFGYPLDEPLHAENGGIGFTGPWIEAGISGDYDQIQAGSLSFGALETSGKSVQSRAPSESFTDLSRNITDIPGTPGTTLWSGFLLRKDTSGGTPPEDYFGLTLYPAAGDGLFIGDPFENDFYSLGIAGSSFGLVASNKGVITSATVFLVVKVEFLAGADRISLYVNPTPGMTEPSTADAVKSDFNLAGIDSIGFVGGSSTANPRWSFDEIRLGTSYSDIAPIPETSSMAILTSALLLLQRRKRRQEANDLAL